MSNRNVTVEMDGRKYEVHFGNQRAVAVYGWRDLGPERRTILYDIWSERSGKLPGPKTRRIVKLAKEIRRAQK